MKNPLSYTSKSTYTLKGGRADGKIKFTQARFRFWNNGAFRDDDQGFRLFRISEKA